MKSHDDFRETVEKTIQSVYELREKAVSDRSKASQAFDTAMRAFNNKISDNKKILKAKKEEIEDELRMLHECEKTMKDSYAEKVMSGDVSEIKHLESELKAISEDIRFAESRIELLDSHSDKGDEEQYNKVVAAYRQQLEIENINCETLNPYYRLIETAIDELKKLQKITSWNSYVNSDSSMVKVYEIHNGYIYPDEKQLNGNLDAKIEFIHGIYRGQ